jgi:type I restriction enzyme S subunit
MHEWPSDWATTELGTLITRIEAGLNVKCEERPPRDGERGLVKISAVTWGRFDELQSKTLLPDAIIEEKNQIRTGDLLISRANTIELVGSSVIVGPFERTLYLSDKVLRLVVDERSKRWVNYALKTPWMRKAIEDASSGNQLSMRNLSQDKLRALPIPVAPLAEQQRIADKLDSVLARVESCRDRLARGEPLLKRFRQSVLAAATSGRLTEDWRVRCEATPEDRATGLPVSWSLQSVSRYATNHNGARVPVSEELRRERKGSFPYYGASGPIDTIDGYTHDGSFLLVGEDGANLLSRSKPIAFTASGKIWVNNHAHVLSCDDEASLAYLGFVVNAMDLAPFVTGSAQPKLTKKNLDQLPVPAPPKAETTEIVRRVETLFAFADRLEARLAQAQTAVDRLTPSLLAKAFRGELVPQDPADEPAAELLNRLKSNGDRPSFKSRGHRRGTGRSLPSE